MNEKPVQDRRDIIIKVRLNQKEWTRLIAMASVFSDGDISKLIRHAVDTMPTRPKDNKKKVI